MFGNNMMMQAFGAMMRGESPQDFLRQMASTNPSLQGLNLDDLEGTANKLAAQKGADINQLKNSVKSTANRLM